jgi:hypothetical protein
LPFPSPAIHRWETRIEILRGRLAVLSDGFSPCGFG